MLPHTDSTNFQRIKTMNLAVLSRTANSTIPNWQTMFESLKQHAEQHLDLISIANGLTCPPHWQREPYAVTLARASTFFSDTIQWPDHTKNILNSSTKLAKPQQFIYRAMAPIIQPFDLATTLEQRANRILNAPLPPHFPWHHFLRKLHLRPSPPHIKIHVVRTLLNCWTTSFRMHEPVLRHCIFGCRADDNIKHYANCQTLWLYTLHALNTADPDAFAPHFLSSAVRSQAFEAIALSSLVYCALKHNPKSNLHLTIYETCQAFVRKHSLSSHTS